MTTLIEKQARTEAERFRLLVERDGRDAALAWAQRTVTAYQEAVANPSHFASTREYRGIYEAAIAALQTLMNEEAGS